MFAEHRYTVLYVLDTVPGTGVGMGGTNSDKTDKNPSHHGAAVQQRKETDDKKKKKNNSGNRMNYEKVISVIEKQKVRHAGEGHVTFAKYYSLVFTGLTPVEKWKINVEGEKTGELSTGQR